MNFCTSDSDKSFKDYLKDQIEQQMTEEGSPPVCIASIHFAYDNGELIRMLEERGNLFVTEDTKGVQKIEL